MPDSWTMPRTNKAKIVRERYPLRKRITKLCQSDNPVLDSITVSPPSRLKNSLSASTIEKSNRRSASRAPTRSPRQLSSHRGDSGNSKHMPTNTPASTTMTTNGNRQAMLLFPMLTLA